MKLEFEWHKAKAEANLCAHGNVLLFVAYTERKNNECIRIISARRATQDEQDDYFRQNA